jgi:hypothetical protein
MSALNGSWFNRIKSLNGWLPRLPARRGPPSRFSRRQFTGLAISGIEDSLALSQSEETLQLVASWQPALEATLAELKRADLPEKAALLGVCEDGLPFILDLDNPASGAILVLGDPASGKTALLQALLASLGRMNQPGRVAFNVIARQPDEYERLEDIPGCQRIYPVESPSLGNFIAGLVRKVETCKRAGTRSPAMLLAIDDLDGLLPLLDEDAYNSLCWLIRHGPRYQVWTLAALSSRQLPAIAPRYLSAFRSRIFGHMREERLARRLGNNALLTTRDLEAGLQFISPYDEEWLRFRLCAWGEAGPLEEPIQKNGGGVL